MIISNVQLVNPFPEIAVTWRSVDFAASDINGLSYRDAQLQFSVSLPFELTSAVAKRRSEFLAGRLCAAHGLLSIGADPEVGRADNLPVWPNGISGSISHTDGHAVADISAKPMFRSRC